jgi:hypothetical protein
MLDLNLTLSFIIETMRITILAVALAAAWVLNAEDGNPLSTEARRAYSAVKKDILKSAEKMPEENYSFKPAEGC